MVYVFGVLWLVGMYWAAAAFGPVGAVFMLAIYMILTHATMVPIHNELQRHRQRERRGLR